MLPGPVQYHERKMDSMYINNNRRMDSKGGVYTSPKQLSVSVAAAAAAAAAEHTNEKKCWEGGRFYLNEEFVRCSAAEEYLSRKIAPTLRRNNSEDIVTTANDCQPSRHPEKTSSSSSSSSTSGKDENTVEEFSRCQIGSNPDEGGESYGLPTKAPVHHREDDDGMTPPPPPPPHQPSKETERLAFCQKSRCPALSRLKRHAEMHNMS
jgi:hypothetical protein